MPTKEKPLHSDPFVWPLRGICTANQNWACFVCYLKITSIVNCWKNSSCVKILGGLKLLMKLCKLLFWSITQELIGPLNLKSHFWVSNTPWFRTPTLLFSTKGVGNFEKVYKTSQFWLGCSTTLQENISHCFTTIWKTSVQSTSGMVAVHKLSLLCTYHIENISKQWLYRETGYLSSWHSQRL